MGRKLTGGSSDRNFPHPRGVSIDGGEGVSARRTQCSVAAGIYSATRVWIGGCKPETCLGTPDAHASAPVVAHHCPTLPYTALPGHQEQTAAGSVRPACVHMPTGRMRLERAIRGVLRGSLPCGRCPMSHLSTEISGGTLPWGTGADTPLPG